MLENEFINLVDNDGLKMINKKIMIPLNKQELLEQHKFIGYLYNNGINTANIFKLYESDKHYYELQEYIENNNEKYTTKNIMKLLAKFHNVSKKYNLNFSKKKYYCHNFKCNYFELNKLSIEFARYRDRWDKLSRSIETVNKDVLDIHTTTEKISKRFDSINKVDIKEIETEEE